MIGHTEQLFDQMIRILNKIDDSLYREESVHFENGSIGKHFRHIINFYDELISAYHSGELCYDNRKREVVYEEFPKVAARRLREIIDLLSSMSDRELNMFYKGASDEDTMVKTTFIREVHYNLGHVTHHLAIIKIYLNQLDPSFDMEQDFGLAFSTIRNNN